MTGCEFAKLLPGKAGRVAIEVHIDSDLAPTHWLNQAFEEHAKHDRVVIAVFPHITAEIILVDFLNTLGSDARWAVTRHSKTSPRGDVLVGVEWTTALGDISETMGFAPFAAMPVPRRAPYVALATWPGGRSNLFRGHGSTPPGRPGVVSFLDSAHSFDTDHYEALWSKTSARVGALMTMPPDDPKLYRRTAFVLSTVHADKLRTNK
jgi:hypothetical protein